MCRLGMQIMCPGTTNNGTQILATTAQLLFRAKVTGMLLSTRWNSYLANLVMSPPSRSHFRNQPPHPKLSRANHGISAANKILSTRQHQLLPSKEQCLPLLVYPFEGRYSQFVQDRPSPICQKSAHHQHARSSVDIFRILSVCNSLFYCTTCVPFP